VLEPDPSARVLMRAVRNGEPVGDLARLRGQVLEFAADPFSSAPVSLAALLLDNSIDVLTGIRPSERPGFEVVEGRLPTERAAKAAPFEPAGGLDLSTARDAEFEITSWLLLAGAVLLGAAAWTASRPKS
jgi:hypothetical protein